MTALRLSVLAAKPFKGQIEYDQSLNVKITEHFLKLLEDFGWFHFNDESFFEGFEVCRKRSTLGFCDLFGNKWEWSYNESGDSEGYEIHGGSARDGLDGDILVHLATPGGYPMDGNEIAPENGIRMVRIPMGWPDEKADQ